MISTFLIDQRYSKFEDIVSAINWSPSVWRLKCTRILANGKIQDSKAFFGLIRERLSFRGLQALVNFRFTLLNEDDEDNWR